MVNLHILASFVLRASCPCWLIKRSVAISGKFFNLIMSFSVNDFRRVKIDRLASKQHKNLFCMKVMITENIPVLQVSGKMNRRRQRNHHQIFSGNPLKAAKFPILCKPVSLNIWRHRKLFPSLTRPYFLGHWALPSEIWSPSKTGVVYFLLWLQNRKAFSKIYK